MKIRLRKLYLAFVMAVASIALAYSTAQAATIPPTVPPEASTAVVSVGYPPLPPADVQTPATFVTPSTVPTTPDFNIELPNTGSDTNGTQIAAVTLITLGGMILVVRRRAMPRSNF